MVLMFHKSSTFKKIVRIGRFFRTARPPDKSAAAGRAAAQPPRTIPYTNVLCDASTFTQYKLSDSRGAQVGITHHECAARCSGHARCRYYLWGERAWSTSANRCVLYSTCDVRREYTRTDNAPNIYKRPAGGACNDNR